MSLYCNGSGLISEKLAESRRVLVAEAKKLYEELNYNNKGSLNNNTQNGSCEWRNPSMLQRLDTLERIVMTVVKLTEVQDEIISNLAEKIPKTPRLLKPQQPVRIPPPAPLNGDMKYVKPVLEVKQEPHDLEWKNEMENAVESPKRADDERSEASKPSSPLSDSSFKLNHTKQARIVRPNPVEGRTRTIFYQQSSTGVGEPTNGPAASEILKQCILDIFSDPSKLESASDKLKLDQRDSVEEIAKIAETVTELAVKNLDAAKLGADICQKLGISSLNFKNKLIVNCQNKFFTLVKSLDGSPELEEETRNFLWFLAHLYLHSASSESGRIRIFSFATVELLRCLLGEVNSKSCKENLAFARKILQLLKSHLIEETSPELPGELTKLAEQCEKLKSSGHVTPELKSHLLMIIVLISGIRKTRSTA